MSRLHSLSFVAMAGVIAACVALNPSLADDQPASKRDRGELQAPQMRVKQVPPRLKEILENWEKASGEITSLEGRHDRFVYDNTFNIGKQSRGNFYFVAPDKGRIDIQPAKLDANAKADRINAKTGEKYDLSPDEAEIWIADGQNVLQIKPTAKTASLFEVPQGQRGKNVIYTELPFLFGLPANQALERFDFTLVRETNDHIRLLVKPRWDSDAANWRQAEILLSKATYLPSAVELTDPAGTMITVFSFVDFQKNLPKPLFGLFKKDPFKYPLDKYQVQVHTAGPQQAGAAGPQTAQLQADPAKSEPSSPPPSSPEQPKDLLAAANVPSVIGMFYKDASKTLQERGFKVELKQGSLARNPKDLFTVEQQRQVGETVFLFLYDKPREAKMDKAQSRTTAKPKSNAVQ